LTQRCSRQDIGTEPLESLGNLLSLLLAGWWLALGHVLTAILLGVTIVGIHSHGAAKRRSQPATERSHST
jgi:uncharacterized membrane protein YccF (DUF307 family)